MAEYYGSQNPNEATGIRYIQLKHSTLRADQPWNPSELESTFAGFAEWYVGIKKRARGRQILKKVEFSFVSNRPMNKSLISGVEQIAEGVEPTDTALGRKLAKYTSLSGQELIDFCTSLRLEVTGDGLWEQQNLITQDLNSYLPGKDIDAPIQLKDLVTRKATSEGADDPAITKIDVLRALRTDESRLFPANCRITMPDNIVPREQEQLLIDKIVSGDQPVIVHAAGGLGKSVFATQIGRHLSETSVSIVYDCFGNGQYRNRSGYRHRHKDGLVQIVNELAGRGLCYPLIPSPHADTSDYVRAFISRLDQSIESLRAKDNEAVLYIVIDAADNAEMAAKEIGESGSFVRDLLREPLPKGVRVVALCRTHRQEYLKLPPDVLRLELLPFSPNETGIHLRQFFSEASEQDVEEFHRLSSQNPRVQSAALDQQQSLPEVLRSLGPHPTTIDDMLEKNFIRSIKKLHDEAGSIEEHQIEKICAGLAVLRPLIPLSVLAAMSGVDESAIHSFASDLGRPLLIVGDSIQFRDEPTETWFQQRFKPKNAELSTFVSAVKPLANKSTYVAAILPQLMLEAGKYDELIALALSSELLPDAGSLERRDIELQRLQFALKASLRMKRYVDAAKLSLKAGGESAGDERQRKLIQENTDLASKFLNLEQLETLVSRREFVTTTWTGSHHAYEAAVLAGRRELLGAARSHLRMAKEWIVNWARLPQEQRKNEPVSDDDIVEMASAIFNLYGAKRCVAWLRGWRPREVAFRVGRKLAQRFVDHGRFAELQALGEAARYNGCLLLAIVLELHEVGKSPPKGVVKRAFRVISTGRWKPEATHFRVDEWEFLDAVIALVQACLRRSVASPNELIALLNLYLPPSPPRGIVPHHSGGKFPLLRGYALRSTLSGHQLALIDLAHDELRQELEHGDDHLRSSEAQQFKERVGKLLPWHNVWAASVVDPSGFANKADIVAELRTTAKEYSTGVDGQRLFIVNAIARVWFDTIQALDNDHGGPLEQFREWVSGLERPLFTKTLKYIARRATEYLGGLALDYAAVAFQIIRDERTEAESKIESYIGLARAVLAISPPDAKAYFDQALEVASKIGEENLERWNALLQLAARAGASKQDSSKIAYRLSRAAELTYEYVYRDKYFDWGGTVEGIAGLCGRSALGILSRWRDRRFGDERRLLPIAINYLVMQGRLKPKVALPLIGFRYHWNKISLLQRFLSETANKREREIAADFVHSYMVFDRYRSQTWRELKELAVDYSIEFPNLDHRINMTEREEFSTRERGFVGGFDADESVQNEMDWNAVFEGINLIVPSDIDQAYRRTQGLGFFVTASSFFQEAMRRVPIGRKSEFITALADVGSFDLFHLRNLMEELPERWRARPAIQSSLGDVFRVYCRRFCMEITRDRRYEPFPFEIASTLSGISEHELLDEVLNAVGKAPKTINRNRLFTLIGLLVPQLTPKEALETLAFGLDLLEDVLDSDDTEDVWSSDLVPEGGLEDAVAGYIWAGLGSPAMTVRWEAAHVVRALCFLGVDEVLDRIVMLEPGSTVKPFIDPSLHFYELHARQWLLIGLARAAHERPDAVARHRDFLLSVAFDGEPHFLMREFSKQVLLTLLDSGHLLDQRDLRKHLIRLNVSPFPSVKMSPYERVRLNSSANTGNPTSTKVDDDYYFGINVGRYWFAPLGRCFGLTPDNVEREVLKVIRRAWGISDDNRWENDERTRRRVFEDMETYASDGSFARADNLSFYRSYHATMIAVGKLLSKEPLTHEPGMFHNELSEWLQEHVLSRDDGRWLSDRRDSKPLERPDWMEQRDANTWHRSISRDDFERVLFGRDGRINVWSSWTRNSNARRKSVSIRSALVSRSRSMALLSALYSVEDVMDYRVPHAEDELQIAADNFQLRGWVRVSSPAYGIDSHDPWAGSIDYPPPEPAPFVIDLLNLSADDDERRQFSMPGQGPVAWVEVWGCPAPERSVHDVSDGDNGCRFQVAPVLLNSLLTKLDMDLIVEVQIERRGRHEGEDDIGYIPRSARLFLFTRDRTYITF